MSKNIFVDIDNTICFTNGLDYENSIPNVINIKKINKYYRDGHNITYWTARGSSRGVERDLLDLTYSQLKKWGCKFHNLKMGKPVYDIFIDDKTLNPLFHWENDKEVNKILNL